jgi:hypothetical protein
MTKTAFTAVTLLAVVLLGATVASGKNYGSYISTCDASNSTFINFAAQDCKGPSTNMSSPLNQCAHELLIFSWNAVCNATMMAYNNFPNSHCGGKPVLTRWYTNNACFNCPNKECKNP